MMTQTPISMASQCHDANTRLLVTSELIFGVVVVCRVIKCIVNIRVIVAFINSSLYSCETYRQVKEMDNLNLFIDSHYKYIVSIIRVKHILTLHLSTANC